MFRKVLIANRGEIAVRIIRACRELGISPVAVYSDADRASLHVRLADEAVHVGPAPSTESYLAIEHIIAAAVRTGAEAVHPGYGFLSENPGFAGACEDAGLRFVGPSAASMSLMGNKTAARSALLRSGVPIVPGSHGTVASAEEARAEAARIGYPVMLKASAGGGGKGMRLVASEKDLAGALEAARSEAAAAFGDPAVYVEKYLSSPRHVEIQVLADLHGNAVYLGERECSIQRRHQKVVEEAPSPLVDGELRRRMGEAALLVVRAANYQNAGTVEFLVDGSGDFYFLEMNTRLQVEHPVTECVTGIDLVREQFRISSGAELGMRQEDVMLRGWALECRIYAEDPERNFFPSPGTIDYLVEPQGPGVRVDSGVYEGWEVPIHYDPLIAKLVTSGSDRRQAVARMKRAVDEYRIDGIRTNLSFFAELLRDPEFEVGRLSTSFIEEFFRRRSGAEREDPGSLAAAAIAAALAYRDQAGEPAGAERLHGRSRWRSAESPRTPVTVGGWRGRPPSRGN